LNGETNFTNLFVLSCVSNYLIKFNLFKTYIINAKDINITNMTLYDSVQWRTLVNTVINFVNISEETVSVLWDSTVRIFLYVQI